MGLWELLDQACALLTEAGYPDPWSWTPRQILHRLSVHRRLRNNDALRDLDIALLAARGDEKHLSEFRQSLSETGSPDPSDAPERVTVPVAKSVSERLSKAHADLPWSDRP